MLIAAQLAGETSKRIASPVNRTWSWALPTDTNSREPPAGLKSASKS